MTCATKHPDRPELSCILPRTERGHREHLAMVYVPGRSQPDSVTWPDLDYRSPEFYRQQGQEAAQRIQSGAVLVREQIRLNTPQRPLGRAAGQRKKTRLGQVANLLVNNVGVWIDGHRLATVEIGGSEGLKRLRELRDDYGWHIENRPVPNSTDQYRLVELPDEFKDADVAES
jgi:hypothetical protein